MNDVIPTKETLQKGNYQQQETAKAGVLCFTECIF